MPLKTLQKYWYYWVLAIIIVALLCFSGDLAHWWRTVLFAVQQQQNSLHRAITKALTALRHGGDATAWWAMVSLGFTYGILHAVGPGHGKAVVTTFLLTQPSNYKSALTLAVGGALLQGISAIVWVALTLGIMQWLIREAVGQVIWATRLSYILIILTGVYIVWRQWRRLRGAGHPCGCGHHHDDSHTHHHDDEHHACCTASHHDSCDHAHHEPHPPISPPIQSYRTHILAMLAIGIRPCSGAILSLAVAAGWGLWGVGVAMTFAMAVGTAITVVSLALLTIFGRERLALHLSQRTAYWQQGLHWLVMVGGVILVILGALMLLTSNRDMLFL